MSRDSYKSRLDRYLGFSYDKRKETCKILYDTLLPYQDTAIRNAEIVFAAIGDHPDIGAEESSTRVHCLVKELNKYIWLRSSLNYCYNLAPNKKITFCNSKVPVLGQFLDEIEAISHLLRQVRIPWNCNNTTIFNTITFSQTEEKLTLP